MRSKEKGEKRVHKMVEIKNEGCGKGAMVKSGVEWRVEEK